jgi:hypothetical protein
VVVPTRGIAAAAADMAAAAAADTEGIITPADMAEVVVVTIAKTYLPFSRSVKLFKSSFWEDFFWG